MSAFAIALLIVLATICLGVLALVVAACVSIVQEQKAKGWRS